MIHLHHVTKTFQNHWKALEDITLAVDKGEFVVLTGPSGAGKSTLLKMIYMEQRPDSSRGGQVLISFGPHLVYDSKTTPDRDLHQFRRRMGVIFQDFRLLADRDVFENVALALRVHGFYGRKLKNKVYEAMQLVGIAHLRNALPHTLSGGERQRVAIARAIAHQPSLVLADEPTGNLDPENAREIMELLMRINAMGSAVVMVTHNPELFEREGIRRVRLVRGRLQNKDLI